MGYDIHGAKPTAPEGVYFRRSIWAWPPLTALCRELAPDITSNCKYWTSNDGDGLDADAAAQLAERLQQLIADGTIADYVTQFRAMLARLPDVACEACEGRGRISRAVVKTVDALPGPLDSNGDIICLPCAGAGHRCPFMAYRPLDEEDVEEWARFLRSCGGFCIR
jgi:hypothetical protein